MDTEIAKVMLPNGAVYIEARRVGLPGAPQPVAAGRAAVKFDQLMEPLKGITDVVFRSLREMKVPKATVEFGMEMAMESGALTALLVRGSGTANLKVTLEWSRDERP